MASKPISTSYFINPSHQPVCLHACPSLVAREQLSKNRPIVARQRLSKSITAATNTHATIEELLDASFSMRSVSCQGKQVIKSSQNILFFLSIVASLSLVNVMQPLWPKYLNAFIT
jgi:hypothetical protein